MPSPVRLSPKLDDYVVQPNERYQIWLFMFVDWFTTIFIPSLYKMSPIQFNIRSEILMWNITSYSNI